MHGGWVTMRMAAVREGEGLSRAVLSEGEGEEMNDNVYVRGSEWLDIYSYIAT